VNGWQMIEPMGNTPTDDDSQRLALSQAISLKRIADALDKQNEIALAIAQGFPTGDGA
jgi:hypothetical protein